MRKLLLSEKGLTLTELLAGLTITGFVSVLIIGYITNGMTNFNKVNEEVLLHDEANYVMSQFENEIIVAKNVEEVQPDKLYTVTKLMKDSNTNELIDSKVTLGFKNNEAVINDQVIHSSRYEITESSIQKKKNNMYIKMTMEDTESKHELKIELENRIPYIHIETIEGGADE